MTLHPAHNGGGKVDPERRCTLETADHLAAKESSAGPVYGRRGPEVPLNRVLTLRLTPDGYRRLEAIAEVRHVKPGHAVRQLIDEADVDVPAKSRRKLSEDELLDLLRERATDGNVAAIVRLLEIERSRDPRSEALAALQRIAEERRS
jgi:hypothetical protein